MFSDIIEQGPGVQLQKNHKISLQIIYIICCPLQAIMLSSQASEGLMKAYASLDISHKKNNFSWHRAMNETLSRMALDLSDANDV